MKKQLTLYYLSELEIVEDYQSITAIRISNYYNIHNFEHLLQRCINVEELHLVKGFLQPEPPLFAAYFPKLQTLVLDGVPLSPLLPILDQLVQIKRLALKKQHFTSFPTAILRLDQLEELSLQGSVFKEAVDWSCLTLLPHLKHLNLHKVQFPKSAFIPKGLTTLTQLQELLVHKRIGNQLKKSRPDFCQQIPYLYQHSTLEKKYYTTLLQQAYIHQWSWRYRVLLMNLLAGQKDKLQKLAQAHLVLAATDVLQIEPLRLLALEYYQERWGSEAGAILKQNNSLAVQGKLSIDKRLLRRQLKEQGIRYQAKLQPQSGLLLLGQRSKGGYQQALEWNIPIITEKEIVQYLAQRASAYLVQEEGDNSNLEQLEMLLCSGNEENIQIALTIFEQGGFPPTLLTALFWAHQLTDNQTTKRALERLLGQHASIPLLEYIKSKQLLFPLYSYESSIKRRLKKLEKYTELNVIQLAWYGYQKYAKGLVYLLTALPTTEAIQLLQTKLSTNQTLDLSNKDLTTVPPVVFKLNSIKTLNLSYNNQLKTIAIKGLKQLPNLQHLLIDGNSRLRNNTKWIMAVAQQLPDLQVYYYNLPH
jgi:Leucine-rich repeat (LRR) protein